jgi:prevent-host-death family protein
MKTVNMHEAKAHLSRLVDEVRTGKEPEVVIALAGRPAVRMVPTVARRSDRWGWTAACSSFRKTWTLRAR